MWPPPPPLEHPGLKTFFSLTRKQLKRLGWQCHPAPGGTQGCTPATDRHAACSGIALCAKHHCGHNRDCRRAALPGARQRSARNGPGCPQHPLIDTLFINSSQLKGRGMALERCLSASAATALLLRAACYFHVTFQTEHTKLLQKQGFLRTISPRKQ